MGRLTLCAPPLENANTLLRWRAPGLRSPRGSSSLTGHQLQIGRGTEPESLRNTFREWLAPAGFARYGLAGETVRLDQHVTPGLAEFVGDGPSATAIGGKAVMLASWAWSASNRVRNTSFAAEVSSTAATSQVKLSPRESATMLRPRRCDRSVGRLVTVRQCQSQVFA